jgi:predicted metal-dependent peptidase
MPKQPKSKIDYNAVADRVERQNVRVVVDHPFWSSLLLQMGIEQTDRIPTACTDGSKIYYNPEYYEGLTDQQIFTVQVHEVGHPAFGHLWRKGDRDMQKWNMACDYELNNFLMEYNDEEVAAGRLAPFDFPDGALIDPAFKGKSAEEIYNLIPDPPQGDGRQPGDQPGGQPGDQPGDQPGGQPGGQPGDDMSDTGGGMGDFTKPAAKDGNTEAEWKNRIAQAHNAAKLQGRGSGSIGRAVDRILKGEQDWRYILRDLLSAVSADDYDEQRPDRRFLEDDIYLPSLYSEKVGEFVVAVDTSGSVTDELLRKFMGEVQVCLDTVKPQKITVLDCDAQIYQVQEFTEGDYVETFQPKGGGGTDFNPVFDHVAQMSEQPEAVVYFTDGMGDFPKEAPPYPVIWVDYGGTTYPFGEVVRVNSAA